MKLALRAPAATDANAAEKAFAAITRWRLASQWCHGGIVIGDTLYQVNARNGLHSCGYTPERWWHLDLGSEGEERALDLFRELEGTEYDYLGVLGFGLPVRGDDDRLYCFEWCAMAMGVPHHRWMTPERLLAHITIKHDWSVA